MIQAKHARVKEAEKGRFWLKLVALGVGIYLTWVLGKGVFELRLAYKRIDEARQILSAEEAKSRELQKKWTEVQTSNYIEKVARNDLNMQKEGETVVILPTVKQKSEASQPQGEEKDILNYQKWWNLIK